MQIKVCVFAHLRERCGFSERRYELPEHAKLADVLTLLFPEPAEWQRLAPSLMLAVNRQYTSAEHVLLPGDEVAIIPPVAGG